jgi:hypothetical protein
MRSSQVMIRLTIFAVCATLAACGGGGSDSPPPAAAPAPAPVSVNAVPDITTTTVPRATVGVAYASQLAATPGDGASHWSIASGNLPAGLALSATGMLSGTPSASGSVSVTVRVADSDTNSGASDEDSLVLSVSVDPAPVPPTPAPSTTPVNIVVIGASTSACKNLVEGGYTLADCWVNRFAVWLQARRPGSSVQNLAVSGTGTCHGLPSNAQVPALCPAQDPHPIPDVLHNITQALAAHPDLVVVNYPHDYQMGVDATIANLLAIQAAANAAGVPVWITTSQPAFDNPAVRDLRILQRDRVLATFGNRAIDFWTPLADPLTGTMSAALVNHYDDSHPNAEGHRLLSEAAKAAMGL